VIDDILYQPLDIAIPSMKLVIITVVYCVLVLLNLVQSSDLGYVTSTTRLNNITSEFTAISTSFDCLNLDIDSKSINVVTRCLVKDKVFSKFISLRGGKTKNKNEPQIKKKVDEFNYF
jgi:hypothetical protein